MPNNEDFPRLLTLLGRDKDVIRLARGDTQIFTSTPIPAENIPPALDALFASDGKWNLWYEVNQTSYTPTGGRSSAQHITRLSALWADLDYKPKPGGLGSYPEAMEVVADLSNALGIQPSAIVHSGHGIQPYWPVEDGDLTDENRDAVATLLKRWGSLVKQFALNNHGSADSVFDLPRIMRVPGSVNWKDPEHPVETSVDFFDSSSIDLAWLAEVLDDYAIPMVDVETSGDIVEPMDGWEWSQLDCQFAQRARLEIVSSTPHARHQWALKWAGVLFGMIRHGCVTERGFYELRDALMDRFTLLLAAEGSPRPFNAREFDGILKQGQRWAETWSKGKLSEELRHHVHADTFVELLAQAPVQEAPRAQTVVDSQPVATVSSIFTKAVFAPAQASSIEGNLALALDSEVRSQHRLSIASLTDIGNAERLSMHLRGRFIWVPSLGWHEWSGERYLFDSEGSIVEAAKDMFINLRQNAPDDAHMKWAHRSLMKGSLDAAIKLCQTVSYLVVSPMHLDAKPYELNTPEGIVDLYTGKLRTSDPTVDFHTLSTAQVPQEMPIPKFLEFLSWAMSEPLFEGQPVVGGRVRYLQHLFGLAAIGQLRHHVFPILLGVGSNGKTTLLDIIAGALGSYAAAMPPNFLIEKKSEAHPTEIAQLRGIRMATSSEVPPGSRFDEALVKTLTGETRLRARFMGKDFFEFNNTCTLFLAANHLPQVTRGGVSFWRRARKIDFREQVMEANVNESLVVELLREEGPGILQWVIDGAAYVLKNKLVDPAEVVLSTEAYQLEEDTIARFIQENLTPVDGGTIVRSHVYHVYQNWMREQGLFPLSAVKFAREMVTTKPQMNLVNNTVYSNVNMNPLFLAGDWEKSL